MKSSKKVQKYIPTATKRAVNLLRQYLVEANDDIQ
jgi:hypothetical protein